MSLKHCVLIDVRRLQYNGFIKKESQSLIYREIELYVLLATSKNEMLNNIENIINNDSKVIKNKDIVSLITIDSREIIYVHFADMGRTII